MVYWYGMAGLRDNVFIYLFIFTGLTLWKNKVRLNALVVNQNNIVGICLNKFTLEGPTKANYRELCCCPLGCRVDGGVVWFEVTK